MQEKLYQEVIQESSVDQGAVSLEQTESMGYLNAFLNEVLRLYPPVGMMMRSNQYEEEFAGYKIPPKTSFVIPVHLLHRHPKKWKDPETFRPERWLEEEKSVSGLDTRDYTFLPFGAGGRFCIGYRLAQIEAKLIMASLVKSLRVEIAPSQRDIKHAFTTIVTMKAKPALKIVVKKR